LVGFWRGNPIFLPQSFQLRPGMALCRAIDDQTGQEK
jgi:hypothetical protein